VHGHLPRTKNPGKLLEKRPGPLENLVNKCVIGTVLVTHFFSVVYCDGFQVFLIRLRGNKFLAEAKVGIANMILKSVSGEPSL
jgi:hypothetical protein